ncbi:protein argonaute 4-like, partial [Trifolium pratense]
GWCQFNQVLNIELSQVIEACKFLDEAWNPKFLVIVAQKNHHTKFFQPGSPDNVPPGTVVDNKICHPRNYDFYLCAHAGMIGTSRPTHYNVLLDEIGFPQMIYKSLCTHFLMLSNNNICCMSNSYQRSTTAISVVAPICYAHLAASEVGQFMKFED